MAVTDISESPDFKAALGKGMKALRDLADYELDDAIQARLMDLGEQKEYLSESENGELLALVKFTERRQIEKLEAQIALRDLEKFVPELKVS